MISSAVMTAIGLATSVVGTGMQYKASQDAAEANEKAFKAQEAQANTQNLMQIREQFRKARVAQGAIANQGGGANTLGSSGVSGGMGSVATQAATNVGAFNTIRGYQAEAGAAQVEFGQAQGASAMGGAIGNLGGTIFELGGGWDTVFGRKQPGQD